jgi:hypothetical protein
MVGPGRLELPTSRLSGVRSNHLSYGPIRVSTHEHVFRINTGTPWAWFVYPFEERETWTAKIAIPSGVPSIPAAYCVSIVT